MLSDRIVGAWLLVSYVAQNDRVVPLPSRWGARRWA
jgi:hypothetical protein